MKEFFAIVAALPSAKVITGLIFCSLYILEAVLCIGLLSCRPTYDEYGNEIGDDPDTAEYKWGEWEDPKLMSIADDSLAILAIYKHYYKEWNECGWSGCYTDMEVANYRIGLFLVNYREKQKPAWGDNLEYNLIIVKEYFRDSSVLVYDRGHNKFGLWKIGTTAVEFFDYIDYSGKISWKHTTYDARPFSNGNILLSETFSYKYPKFLLEPKNRQLKPFEFSGEYEWLSKCARTLDPARYDNYYNNWALNISYIGGKLSCISGNGTTNNFELIVENVVMDTSSLSKSYIEYITGWYGNYVKDAANKIYKIDTLNFKFDRIYNSGSVHYTTQDLLRIYE